MSANSTNHRSARFFEDADLMYRTKIPGIVLWGPYGTALLRQLQKEVNQHIEKRGFAKVLLPSTAMFSPLAQYLGSGASQVVTANFDSGVLTSLAPFSDLTYLQNAPRKSGDREYWNKVYQWNRCYIKEKEEGLLNFGEYLKCELFNLCAGEAEIDKTRTELNNLFIDLCNEMFLLKPLFGYRPAISGFPMAQQTFAAELPLHPYGFQTLMVSHCMKEDYLALADRSDLKPQIFFSSCFSQKLISAVLLHHAGADSLHPPSAIAPWHCAVFSETLSETKLQQAAHRFGLRALHVPTINSRRATSDAPFAIRQDAKGRWTILYTSYCPAQQTDTPPDVSSLEQAFDFCRRRLNDQDRRLKEASSAALAAETYELENMAAYCATEDSGELNKKHNMVMPCCASIRCHKTIAQQTRWIPKLQYTNEEPKPCVVCQEPATGRLLLERRETYTSFYVENNTDKLNAATIG